MKSILSKSVPLLLALAVGIVIGRAWWPDPEDAAERLGDGREILYWEAPMDPSFRRSEPGKSPMGMDLIPVYADEGGDEAGTVRIDPVIVNNLGVRTAPAEHGPLSRRIETVGYVHFAEDTLQHVHTRVDGWIERLEAKAVGDPVRQGQLLFELYSPTLVNAQQEYLAAVRSGTTALREASRNRLLSLGLTAADVERLDRDKTASQRIRFQADRSGVIAHLGVREGVYVMPATEIMSIATLDRVWVQAEVFERQAGWVRHGQRAEVEVDYLPGRRWTGTVDYVYPELDPVTRTLGVRLRFDNEEEILRPNMFARVTLHGTETGPVVHVPREALIRGGSIDRVVLALGDGRFRSQPVETGMEAGGRIEIRDGISAGERVVTSAQFLIDSESNIDAALSRLDEGGAGHEDHTVSPENPPAGHEGHDSPAGGDERGEEASQ